MTALLLSAVLLASERSAASSLPSPSISVRGSARMPSPSEPGLAAQQPPRPVQQPVPAQPVRVRFAVAESSQPLIWMQSVPAS